MAASIAIPNRRLTGGFRVGLAVTLACLACLACSRDSTGPAFFSPAQVYAALQLDQHALIMAPTAPYDTVQLTATPLDGTGAPLTGLGVVTFTSKDSSVTVSPTGLVTAHFVTPTNILVPVIASLRDSAQGVTHQDTAFVVVTATPATAGLATFSMQPAPGDSAKRSMPDTYGGGFFTPLRVPWPVTAADPSADTLCGPNDCSIPVFYHSSNPRVATIDKHTGLITKNDTGHVWLSAQTLYYGQPYRDSVDFRVGLMTDVVIRILPLTISLNGIPGTHIGPKIVLGVGGSLLFWNQGVYGPIQITFSDPAFAGVSDFFPSGNGDFTMQCDSIPNKSFSASCPFFTKAFKARGFQQPGTVQMTVSPFPGFPGRTVEVDVVQE